MHTMQGSTASSAELAGWLRDAHRRIVDSVAGLDPHQLMGPRLTTTNPMLWSVGHVAYFYETWVLRHLRGEGPIDPAHDDLYDSFKVPWSLRWNLPLPAPEGTMGYLAEVLERVLAGLDGGEADERATYFHRLGVFHADMHYEAHVYWRQTLGYPPPPGLAGDGYGSGAGADAGPLPGDVEVPGHPAYRLGASEAQPFVFDNEKWAHPVRVPPFRIARAPVTNEQFAEFVEAGGYYQDRHWSYGGRLWKHECGAVHPAYWRRERGRWLRRQFDRWVPLEPHRPVIHVNFHEAEAYCHWAGRRLPGEAEWELAASAEPEAGGGVRDAGRTYPWGEAPPEAARTNLDGRHPAGADAAALPEGDSAFGCRQMLGGVWEWTADPFYPFPGYVVDPYKEYSAPWFGTHMVLRGGAWMTPARLLRNTWRNYFRPERRDIPAGFRTCAA